MDSQNYYGEVDKTMESTNGKLYKPSIIDDTKMLRGINCLGTLNDPTDIYDSRTPIGSCSGMDQVDLDTLIAMLVLLNQFLHHLLEH